MQTSKIAHCPRHIREELNQRLDRSVPQKQILAWLNSLPEVRSMLEKEFKGEPIKKQNLSSWKKSGFLNWQLSQAALQFTNESLSDELDTATLEKMSAKLLRYLQVRYAALAGSLPELNRDDPDAELHRLAGLCTNLSTLRRGDLSAERLALEHERLALERSREEAEREKIFWEWTKRPDVQEKLYPHRDADKHRRDVERVLNLRLLDVKTPETQPDDSIDPAVLI